MHLILYMVKMGAVLMLFVSLGFVAMSILRGRHIPQCFECGAIKVRPSAPLGFFDLAASILRIQAYRCEGCRARFHVLSLFARTAL